MHQRYRDLAWKIQARSLLPANRDVHRILADAGFQSVILEPRDFDLDIACGGGIEEALEAAMAVGETSGQGAAPRRLITAGGGRRRAEQGEPGSVVTVDSDSTETDIPEGLVDRSAADIAAAPAVPDELERALSEDEEIERRTRDHHETPHFRKEVD